ncbi:ribosome maturation factor RimM [Gleimia europaea]|uniref:Ribosome maturation factor RimM n=1 Tax=Gleimia europaea ACS-120-V-Col10b TaxID=883069 RepID=A0A9W5VVN7_9ACTO|nr:ribosome maturation factor RimM [Gleimia europaea]EPD29356.1 16S rRNA processing protein RimM [Gleimia europaea ACS-120-V-Col10b]
MELLVAVVGPAHALKGEVALDLRTDSPQERFFEGAQFDAASHGVLTVESIRVHKGRMLVKFEEIHDRTDAEELRGAHLMVNVDESQDEDDAWYPHELMGLKVRTIAGEPRGMVARFVPGAAQDLLVVDYDGREVLVPFVRQIVPEVLLDEGTIVVDPPGGLFDDEG